MEILASYHPKLREGVLGDVPETAGDKAFLADGTLSEIEIAALDRAQSVFGMETFYRAWELDALTPNEVHAVLYMLTFYDPYTTVHDVTSDPDDPEAEGAELTRALDDFGVYPGACLYCKKEIERQQITEQVFRRMVLQHLTHHAKVQADALSPCDLRDFTEEELIALGFLESWRPWNHPRHSDRLAFLMSRENFTASVRLNDELLKFEKDLPRVRVRTSKVMIQSGEVLSSFTHAMRAAGGPPSERGLEPCLEAVKRIVDWDAKRYNHFVGDGASLWPYFRAIFPPANYLNVRFVGDAISKSPPWAWFLVDESGGFDKSTRLMNQFRALNLPAIKYGEGIRFAWAAQQATLRGNNGVLLPAWDLYLHRNIGFSPSELQMDPDARIRLYSAPEHCEIHRRSPDHYWKIGMSFWNREGYGRLFDSDAARILFYACE